MNLLCTVAGNWRSGSRLSRCPSGDVPLVTFCRMLVALPVFMLTLLLPAVASATPPPPKSELNPNLFNQLGSQAAEAAVACGAAFQSAASLGSRCLIEQAANDLMNDLVLARASQFASGYGARLFGEHFSLTDRFSWSLTEGGFSGEVDAVIPLFATTGFSEEGDSPALSRAFFLQQGLTRYVDTQGLLRNDLRYGAVQRFNLSKDAGGHLLGISTFFQQNLEYGHSRLVTGLDYDSNWGRGAFHYYLPTSSWRASNANFQEEERALEGMELSLRLKPTTTIALETALTHWEDHDDLARWTTGARIGLNWRPHTWLNLGVDWDGIGTRHEAPAFNIRFSMPLGRTGKHPRWRGLGLQNAGVAARDTMAAIWRPVEELGRIRVAERVTAPVYSAQGLPPGMQVQFLQSSAASGEEIRVQVTLRTALDEDLHLDVQLTPGTGDNPARPGEDYVDESVALIIAAGARNGEVTIRLLRNPDMSEIRSLGVTVLPSV